MSAVYRSLSALVVYSGEHHSGGQNIGIITSMSVRLIVGPKFTPTASHAALWRVTVSTPTGQSDGQTDGRQTVTLRFPLDGASVKRHIFRRRRTCQIWNRITGHRVKSLN